MSTSFAFVSTKARFRLCTSVNEAYRNHSTHLRPRLTCPPMQTRDAHALFQSFFLPLYPPAARDDLAAARRTDANPANNPSFGAALREAAERFCVLSSLDVALDYSNESVHRLGAALSLERREHWIQKVSAEGIPELIPLVIHGAAYVGECIVRNHGGVWQVRNPLWESLVRIKTSMGEMELPVFHWWLRSLADAEMGRVTLGDRYRMYVEEPLFQGEALPVLATAPHTFPKATKTNYDIFYKYLKAHAPEIRDVGADFPSPERFADLKLKWFSAAWLGGGRMLLVYGQNQDGLHLFWLDGKGFRKGAFVACEAFPEARVVTRDDRLELVVSLDGKVAFHEMPWWGK